MSLTETSVSHGRDGSSTATQGYGSDHEDCSDQDVDANNPPAPLNEDSARTPLDADDTRCPLGHNGADRRSGGLPGRASHAARQTDPVHATTSSEPEINSDFGEYDNAFEDYTRWEGNVADTRARRPEWAHRISGDWDTWDLYKHPEMVADVTPYMDAKEACQLYYVEKRPRTKSIVLMPGGKILDVEAGMGVRDYKELYLYYKVKAADTPGNMTWMLDPDADCFKGGRVYEAIPYNERCGLLDVIADSVRTNAVSFWRNLKTSIKRRGSPQLGELLLGGYNPPR